MIRLTPEDDTSSATDIHINLEISQGEEEEPASPPSPLHMPLPPLTTPVPPPVFMPGMSHRAEGPPPPGAEPSPLPIRNKATTNNTTDDSSSDNSNSNNNTSSSSGTPNSSSSSSTPSSSAPVVKPFPLPKLRLQINDLAHAGSAIFLSAVDASSVLASGVQTVLRTLYGSPDSKDSNPPQTRSVTLILRDMDGVAYTTGSDLDSDHKEIHFSLRYIAGINPASRQTHEITGVLVHELVHCCKFSRAKRSPYLLTYLSNLPTQLPLFPGAIYLHCNPPISLLSSGLPTYFPPIHIPYPQKAL